MLSSLRPGPRPQVTFCLLGSLCCSCLSSWRTPHAQPHRYHLLLSPPASWPFFSGTVTCLTVKSFNHALLLGTPNWDQKSSLSVSSAQSLAVQLFVVLSEIIGEHIGDSSIFTTVTTVTQTQKSASECTEHKASPLLPQYPTSSYFFSFSPIPFSLSISFYLLSFFLLPFSFFLLLFYFSFSAPSIPSCLNLFIILNKPFSLGMTVEDKKATLSISTLRFAGAARRNGIKDCDVCLSEF